MTERNREPVGIRAPTQCKYPVKTLEYLNPLLSPTFFILIKHKHTLVCVLWREHREKPDIVGWGRPASPPASSGCRRDPLTLDRSPSSPSPSSVFFFSGQKFEVQGFQNPKSGANRPPMGSPEQGRVFRCWIGGGCGGNHHMQWC
jgi:hypothetical protein